jgi:hypothetical protein
MELGVACPLWIARDEQSGLLMLTATTESALAADNPTRLGALSYFPALASKYF